MKFESALVAPDIPMQGILIKESGNKYLRFEFYGLSGNVRAYVQAFNPNAETAFVNTNIVSAGTHTLIYEGKTRR